MIIFQLVAALGILNVWLVRVSRVTPYRGRDAKNLKEEFFAYGLNSTIFYLVGALKLCAAALLLVGIYFPTARLIGSFILIVLMVGALLMHIKVRDAVVKSLPASIMLFLAAFIFFG